jgi:hypothetical protein
MRFIRHCVECPKCSTRYVVGFSPYANGAFLLQTHAGSPEEYILYCSCGSPPVCSRWKEGQLATYAVCKTAHNRGYGSRKEILRQSSPAADRFSRTSFQAQPGQTRD